MRYFFLQKVLNFDKKNVVKSKAPKAHVNLMSNSVNCYIYGCLKGLRDLENAAFSWQENLFN